MLLLSRQYATQLRTYLGWYLDTQVRGPSTTPMRTPSPPPTVTALPERLRL